MSRFTIIAAFVALACVAYAVAEPCFNVDEMKKAFKEQKEEMKLRFVKKIAKLEQKDDSSLSDDAATEKAVTKIMAAKKECHDLKKEHKGKYMKCFGEKVGMDRQSAEEAKECLDKMKDMALKHLQDQSKKPDIIKCFEDCEGQEGMKGGMCAMKKLMEVCPEVKECLEKGHVSSEES